MTSKTFLCSLLTIGIAGMWLVCQPVAFAQATVDLSLTAITDVDVVPINSNFTYSIDVENLGTANASFVSVTDQLPLGIVFLSSPDACVITGSNVECFIGDLLAGESRTLTYIVRAGLEGTAISNTVSVLAAEPETDTTNNVASTSVAVVVPDPVDIALSGSVSASRLDISDELTVNFTIANSDMLDVYGAMVELILPAQVEFISSDDCTNTGTIILCEAGSIISGTAQSLSLIVRALTAGNPITISGISRHFMTDPDTSNNGISLSFVINDPPPDSADLQFTMTTDRSQIVISEALVITYTLVNLGPNTASNVQIMDDLPSELTFVSSDNCSLVGNSIRCDVGDLLPNAIYIGSVSVTANRISDNIVSSASVTGNEFDPNLFNNIHALALSSIDLTLVATTSPVLPSPSATVTATASPTITATVLPPVQVISTQTSPQVAPVAPAGQDTQDTSSGEDGSPSNPATDINSPLPDGVAPSDIYGWTRYESVDLIQVIGRWQLRSMSNASDGAYHESRDAGALLRYPFEGDGFRIGYRSEVNGAGIQVSLDGEFVNVIATNFLDIDPELAPLRQSFVTQPYWVDTGYHLVDLMCLADGAGSQGCNIDYIEVFIGPPIPEIAQPTSVAIPDNEPVVVVSEVELVSAPPTLAPTSTAIAASVITVDVIVSADLNANAQVDANEGIEGITVRAVNVSDNSLLATSMTDASGFVRITNSTTSDVILLIPVLGESFYIRNRGQTLNETWNLLLDPANIPGLIP